MRWSSLSKAGAVAVELDVVLGFVGPGAEALVPVTATELQLVLAHGLDKVLIEVVDDLCDAVYELRAVDREDDVFEVREAGLAKVVGQPHLRLEVCKRRTAGVVLFLEPLLAGNGFHIEGGRKDVGVAEGDVDHVVLVDRCRRWRWPGNLRH